MRIKMKNRIKEIIHKEIEAIEDLPIVENYEEAINLICKRIHDQGGKLVTSGMGKAGQIALNIATTFSSTGTCSVYLHPSEAQHGDLGILNKEDVLLLLSNSGKTREIEELIKLSRRLHPTIKIIGVTGDLDSPLGRESNVILYTGGAPEICPLGLTPTTSTTLMTIIGDILVVLTMEKIGFTKEEYALRHHGGYNGEKARGEL